MAWFALSVSVFWGTCILLSYFTRRDHEFVDTPAFVFTGVVALFLAFALLVGGATAASRGEPAFGVIFLLVGFIVGVPLAIPWILHAVSVFANEAQRAATGVDQMTVQKSYDAAEKLLFEKRFDEAERAFLAGAESEEMDAQPLRRAGDAALAAGRAEAAVGHFRRALARITSEEDRASLGIRIAEIEQRTLGDATGARRTLEQLLALMGPGKWGDYVRERMTRLDA